MTTSPSEITASVPREIRATVHQDAIQRVTRFFDATVEDCLNEVFQNSRRAGATSLDVTITTQGLITITDNGRGISDPSVILAFGLSQWDDETANSEDPAGMGVYALSRMRQVAISSRAVTAEGETLPGWRVSLQPDHFVGSKSAPVEEVGNDHPSGTVVRFMPPTDESAKDLEKKVRVAARYYPLPVTLNGEEIDSVDFLHQCFYIEEWEGIHIGVTHDRRPYRGHGINLHGLTICDSVNAVTESRDERWETRMDVIDCPHLELTLPARKELVENEFLAKLRQASRRIIYQAMAESQTPVDVTFKQQHDARELGVQLPDARRQLEQWQPDFAESERKYRQREESRGKRSHVTDSSMRMLEYMEPWDQQALARALEHKPHPAVLKRSEAGMTGFRWYDDMTVVNWLEIIVHQADGSAMNVRPCRKEGTLSELDRPERIVYRLHTRDKYGAENWIEYDSDVAFTCDNFGWEGAETMPLVTRTSTITPEELAELIINGYFCYNDDADDDSRETQEHQFRTLAVETARETLLTPTQAVKATIEDAVTAQVRRHLPKGWSAVIRIGPDQQVEVQLDGEDHAQGK